MANESVAQQVVMSEADSGDALDAFADDILGEGLETDEPESDESPEAIDPPAEEATEEDAVEESEEDSGEAEYLTIRHGGKDVTLTYDEALDYIDKGFDYTKKTMALAEDRKVFDAQRQQAVEVVQMQNALLKEYAAVMASEDKLKQYESIDWNAWQDQDPMEAIKAYRNYQEAKAQRDQQVNLVSQKQQQLQQQHAHQLAQVQAKASQDLTGAIRGWDGEKAQSTRDYIASYEALGITSAELQKLNAGVYGAAPIVWAYKAALYDKLQTGKPALKKKLAAVPKVVKPGNSQPAIPDRNKQMAKLKSAKTRKGREALAMDMLDKYI